MTAPTTLARYALIALALIITLFPLLWMLKIGLNSQVDALALPPQWLAPISLDAFVGAWNARGFAGALVNSLVIASVALVLSMSFGLMAAYAFSRYPFPGANLLLYGILFTRVFPPVALIVPFFLGFQALGLRDSHLGLVLAYVALDTPLAIWMLKGYYDAVPPDLENSAMVDGATRFQAVVHVTLPLMAPGIAATAIFLFITSWNEFLFALMLTGRDTQTMPVVIAEFISDTGVDWPEMMAASAIALAPVLILTFALQRHIASGLTGGALKG